MLVGPNWTLQFATSSSLVPHQNIYLFFCAKEKKESSSKKEKKESFTKKEKKESFGKKEKKESFAKKESSAKKEKKN